MTTRADALNRVVLVLLGLLLVAAGCLGLLLNLEAFGTTRSTDPVLTEAVRTFPEKQAWFWWAVAAAAVLTALLAMLWLMAQLRTHRVARLDRTTDAREGYTTLHAGAVTHAVEDEVAGIDGVTRAAAHIYDRPRLRLSLEVGITDSADIDRVRSRLEHHVVAHVRQVLDNPDFPVDIELRPDVRRTPRRTVA